jgi:hypothetical protein
MRNPANILAMLLVVALLLTAGCGLIDKQPLSGDQIAQYWYLEQDPWPQASRFQWEVAGHPVPTKLTIRNRRSAEAAVLSLVTSGFAVMQGAEEVQVSVTPQEARAGADLLRRGRLALKEMQATFSDPHPSSARWARTVTNMLVMAEEVSRALRDVSPEDSGATSQPRSQVQGYQLLVQLLIGRLGGGANAALGDIRAGQNAARINDRIMDGVLRAAFAYAGKEAPPMARQRVQEQFVRFRQPREAQSAVQDVLAKYFDEAPPADAGKPSQQLEMALTVAPALLEVAEQFARQWDKVESVSLEFRKDTEAGGDVIAALTLDIERGQQLRLHVWPLPTMVFAGRCRVTIVPTDDATLQHIVLFDGEGGGYCQVRYEGLLYLLGRLVIPVDNAALRELRVQRYGASRGWNLTNVQLLMDTGVQGRDGRRMYALQTAQLRRPLRGPFEVQNITVQKQQSVSYVRPTARYTWQNAAKGP